MEKDGAFPESARFLSPRERDIGGGPAGAAGRRGESRRGAEMTSRRMGWNYDASWWSATTLAHWRSIAMCWEREFCVSFPGPSAF